MTRIHRHDLLVVVAFTLLAPLALMSGSSLLMLLAGALGVMAVASGLVEA